MKSWAQEVIKRTASLDSSGFRSLTSTGFPWSRAPWVKISQWPPSPQWLSAALAGTCPKPLSVVLFPVVESITVLSLLAAPSCLFPSALRQRWCPPKICLLNSRWTVLEISSCYIVALALKTKYNHPNRLFFFNKHTSFGISISTATLSLLQLWTQWPPSLDPRSPDAPSSPGLCTCFSLLFPPLCA